MINPIRLVVLSGLNIGRKPFNVTLKTPDASTTLFLNKNNISVQIIGKMDVVATFNDRITISVNNPMFGYPYTVFVDADSCKDADKYKYYVGESHDYMDSKSRKFRCTRRHDSKVGKEFLIEVCV